MGPRARTVGVGREVGRGGTTHKNADQPGEPTSRAAAGRTRASAGRAAARAGGKRSKLACALYPACEPACARGWTRAPAAAVRRRCSRDLQHRRRRKTSPRSADQATAAPHHEAAGPSEPGERSRTRRRCRSASTSARAGSAASQISGPGQASRHPTTGTMRAGPSEPPERSRARVCSRSAAIVARIACHGAE